jgi:hypothetical protein
MLTIVIDNQTLNEQHYTVCNMGLGYVCDGKRCFEGSFSYDMFIEGASENVNNRLLITKLITSSIIRVLYATWV